MQSNGKSMEANTGEKKLLTIYQKQYGTWCWGPGIWLICILLPLFCSARLYKKASLSDCSIGKIGPTCMMETTIFYMALGKCFISCMIS